jgi:hypothetical protein
MRHEIHRVARRGNYDGERIERRNTLKIREQGADIGLGVKDRAEIAHQAGA